MFIGRDDRRCQIGWMGESFVKAMKIGLIAMSGVRAWDTELLELALSMPGFVERNELIAQLPSLGLLTLAGCTPASDEISYS